MAERNTFFNFSDEQSLMRLSIAATICVSILGIAFGLASGSTAIMFDGVYSLVDAVMSILSLVVIKLITLAAQPNRGSQKLQERFSTGLWHLEPFVIGLNASMLMIVSIYALFNAVSSLLTGGQELEFGWALGYAGTVLIACTAIAWVERRANKRLKSQFVDMDYKGWVMSGAITAALLVAFLIGLLIEGTAYAHLLPYIDPAVLALVCLFLIPMPIPTIRQCLSDIFLVTPMDLKAHVDRVAADFVEEYGLVTWRAYCARMGRSNQIELYFVVPADAEAKPLPYWDNLRDQVGEAIGDEGMHRWLTVVFTSDLEWAE